MSTCGGCTATGRSKSARQGGEGPRAGLPWRQVVRAGDEHQRRRPTPGTGAIVRVNRHGPPETVVSGLTFPTGMTVGPDGAFYISNQGFGFGAGQGQILRIQV